MTVVVNGVPREVATDTTVAALVAELVAHPERGVAVAVNGAVVPRAGWERRLADGDRVEVLAAVQGGCA